MAPRMHFSGISGQCSTCYHVLSNLRRSRLRTPTMKHFARLSGELSASCIGYAVLSHTILGADWGSSLSWVQSVLRSFFLYSAMFLICGVLPFAISVAAMMVNDNRTKPIRPFLTRALVGTWILALLILFGQWYGNMRVRDHRVTHNLELKVTKVPVTWISALGPDCVRSQFSRAGFNLRDSGLITLPR